jgi:hypothetical protein
MLCYAGATVQTSRRSRPALAAQREAAAELPDRADQLAPHFDKKAPEARITLAKELFADDLRRCVHKVAKLDRDDELYRRTISQPFLRDNSRKGTVFDDAEVGAALAATLRHHGSYLVPRAREQHRSAWPG